jgi:ABC-2 type transport system ATP-binding protein
MGTMLELVGITRHFGQRAALKDVALSLAGGRAVCLVGPNGAGKSTLLAIAAGILIPDSGHVEVLGRRLDAEPQLRRHIGLMADRPLLYGALSGRENLWFYAHLYRVENADERISRLLETVQLAGRAGEPVATYSAGMWRRLDLARAVLHEPQVLLLDEPANSLDTDGQAILASIIDTSRAAGRSVLLTGHDGATAQRWADDIVRIDGGAVGVPAVILAENREEEPAL